MREHWRRLLRVGAPAAAWTAALALGAFALHHPSALMIDLGAGDEAVASGFAEGWARYEVRGRVTYRVTGAAASMALPLRATGRDVTLELRLARFTERATEIALTPAAHATQTWLQHPVGWRLRALAVGAWDGPVALDVRAPADDGQPAGLALDWWALRGVQSVQPGAAVWFGLLALLIATPVLICLLARSSVPLRFGSPLLLSALAFWAMQDTVAAATTVALAGPRVLLACALTLPLIRRAARRSDAADGATGLAFLWLPALALVLALTALSNPRYHYPDIDTHARFLAGMRAHPAWALDPREYQLGTRAWTREIGGRLVGFPYSAAFHVLAWPLAPVLGEVGAIKTVAVMAVAFGLLLVYRLTRLTGSSPGTAILAQGLFALMPVVPSRLTLALLPSLLGQTLELLLLLALATRLSDLRLWRARLAAFLLLAAVQLGYTGSLYNVAAIVLLWSLIEAFTGRWRSAAWLVAAYASAALVVALVQYSYFLPALLSDVLPHLGEASPMVAPGEPITPISVLNRAATRLWTFFLPFGLGLAIVGWHKLAAVSHPVRRALFVALAVGTLLLLLRPALPTLFADAKEVELLAGPMAVAAALGFVRLWRQRVAGRAVALLLLAALVSGSLVRAIGIYASRLLSPLGG